jgi:hypothetical protein
MSAETSPEARLAAALAECGYWRHDYQNRDHAKRILAALPEGTAFFTEESLAAEMGMHAMVDEPPVCDCGDWSYIEDTKTFNEHAAAAIIQAAKEAERE